jgi:MFS family permease
MTPSRASRTAFWWFWSGQTISNFGSSFTLFALPLLIYHLTGSAVILGITTALEFLPYPLFGLVIGAWVDRHDRKQILLLTDIARALILALIPLAAMLHMLSMWWIFGVGFAHASFTLLFDAAQFAVLPSLVASEDLITANGRVQASYSAAAILGPLLAGVLVTHVPLSTLVLLNSATFLVSVLSLLQIRGTFHVAEPARAAHLVQEIGEGIRYVWHHPVLRSLAILLALLNFIEITAEAQLVLLAKQHFHVSDLQVAFLLTAGGGGAVAFSLLAGPVRTKISFRVAALGALMVEGLLTSLFALAPWYEVAVGIWAMRMGISMFFNINAMSLRQTLVPPRLLGRVRTVSNVLTSSATPLGALLGGWTITWSGNVILVYVGIGVLTLAIAGVFWFSAIGQIKGTQGAA